MKMKLKPLLVLVLTASILVPAATILTVGLLFTRSNGINAMTREASVMGYAQSGGVDVLLAECRHMTSTLDAMPDVIQTALGNYNEVGESLSGIIASFHATEPYLKSVVIIDNNGYVLMDSRGDDVALGSLFADFGEAQKLARGEVFLSDITKANAEYDGESTFFTITAIEDGDGITVGYICLVFSAEIFSGYLEQGDFFNHGDFFITDRKGSALWLGAERVTRLDEVGSGEIKDIISSSIGQSLQGENLLNIKTSGYIGSFGQVGVGGETRSTGSWYWFGLYPTGEIDVFPIPIMIVTCMVSIGVLVCVLFMLRVTRSIVGPLKDILTKIRRINEGDTHERFDESGLSGEYAYIAETFNHMMNDVLLSREMQRAVAELSDHILFEWDFGKESMYVSDNFADMFDIDAARATLINGRFIDSIIEKSDVERYKVDLDKMFRSKTDMSGEYRVTTKAGSEIWVSIRTHCVLDRFDEITRVIGVITNINTEKMISLRLSEKASFDFLSGLYNRNTFLRQLQSEIDRHVNSRVGLIFIDVDDFKLVNDRYGHDTGDEIIKRVATIIKEALGNDGFAGRFGGDEFVMCVTGKEMLNNIGEGLSKKVLAEFERGYYSEKYDTTLKIKASLGIAIAPEHGRDSEALLAAADEAMYFVKKHGKDNYRIYDPNYSVLTEINSI